MMMLPLWIKDAAVSITWACHVLHFILWYLFTCYVYHVACWCFYLRQQISAAVLTLQDTNMQSNVWLLFLFTVCFCCWQLVFYLFIYLFFSLFSFWQSFTTKYSHLLTDADLPGCVNFFTTQRERDRVSLPTTLWCCFEKSEENKPGVLLSSEFLFHVVRRMNLQV